MNDAEAIHRIMQLAVETHKELEEFRISEGRNAPSPQEMEEAKYFGVVDRRIHSPDLNEKLVEFLRFWIEDYVGMKYSRMTTRKDPQKP